MTTESRPYLHHHVDQPTVTWVLTDWCNFDCAYCYAKQIGELGRIHAPQFSTERILTSIRRELPGWVLVFLGGEPFLYPGFVDMVVELTATHRVGLYTNLSLAERARDFVQRVDPSRVTFIDCALHPETRERRDPGFRDFIELVQAFRARGFNIGVSSVLSRRTASRMTNDLGDLESSGIRAFVKPFFGAQEGHAFPYAFDPNEVALARRYAPSRAKESVHAAAMLLSRGCFRGRPCTAGINYLEIDSHGEVYRCTTDRHYSRDCLGNIFAGTLRMRTRPRACQSTMCLCSGQGLGYSMGQPLVLSTSREPTVTAGSGVSAGDP